MAVNKKVAKKKYAKKKNGRPTVYSTTVAKKIFLLLAEGVSLKKICSDPAMPSRSTVFKWLAEIDGFSDKYEVAKLEGLEMHADEILEIADNASNDWMDINDPDNPGFKLNGEHIQRSRLRIDSRKWVLSKLVPKKYGDKVDINHGGQEGNPIRGLIDNVAGVIKPK